MASTYDSIATNTLSSAQPSITFNTISGSYTDLILVITPKTTLSSANLIIRFNNDSGANYCWIPLGGDGSTAASLAELTNQNQINVNQYSYPTNTNNNVTICQIQNYANTTTWKTLLARGSNASIGTTLTVGTWMSTAAITSITVTVDGGNLDANSTATIYGITAV